jgi:hypothetical protein
MASLISESDLILINNLSSRTYSNNQLSSNASKEEEDGLRDVKKKLRAIAEHFDKKLRADFGPFEVSVTTGNPMAIGGNKMKRIWSGIFKGGENKQYSAQISFVMNPTRRCLDVGFYFGRAAAHSIKKETHLSLSSDLKELGKKLFSAIQHDVELSSAFNSLFDYGFSAFHKNIQLTPAEWLHQINIDPKESQVTYSIYANDTGVIELSVIDLYVSMIAYLMEAIPNEIEKPKPSKKVFKPLTAEQRAKQAERRTLIGENGEKFVLVQERDRLRQNGFSLPDLPEHTAIKDMNAGYDILSLDEIGGNIFIEVKTTTRLKKDPESRKFYLSAPEYNFYLKNKREYKLYRVYSIEGDPEFEIIDLTKVEMLTDTYRIKYSQNDVVI